MITIYKDKEYVKQECKRVFELLSEIQEETGIDFDEVRHHLHHVYDGARELELWRNLATAKDWSDFWEAYDHIAEIVELKNE